MTVQCALLVNIHISSVLSSKGYTVFFPSLPASEFILGTCCPFQDTVLRKNYINYALQGKICFSNSILKKYVRLSAYPWE